MNERSQREESEQHRETRPPSRWDPPGPPGHAQRDDGDKRYGHEAFDVFRRQRIEPVHHRDRGERVIGIGEEYGEQVDAARTAAPENLRWVELARRSDANGCCVQHRRQQEHGDDAGGEREANELPQSARRQQR